MVGNHSKLKALSHATKEFVKYLSKPYYSILKNDVDASDAGLYYGPLVRNIIGIVSIETAKYIITGKPPELPISNYQAVLLLDGILEGSAVTAGFDTLKRK